MKQKLHHLFSREEYFDKVLKRSGSSGSMMISRVAIKRLDKFCLETFEKNTDELLTEIKQNIDSVPNDISAMIFLDKFSTFLTNDGLSASATRVYVGFAKKYLRLCAGIKISSEDMDDYVTLPANDEGEEELEPYTKEEIRTIFDNSSIRRKAYYMVLKDGGFREREALQLKKKYFDLTRDPATVFVPKKITKGKQGKRVQRLTNETKTVLVSLFKKYNDEDLVFSSNPDNLNVAYKTEWDVFNRLRKRIGLAERYQHNKRFKKNLHSFRAFCYTQSKLATGDADYAHGYIGHNRYLAVYDRLSDKEKDELFLRCAPRLSIYEDIVTMGDDDLRKQVAELRDKLTEALAFANFAGSRGMSLESLPNIEN